MLRGECPRASSTHAGWPLLLLAALVVMFFWDSFFAGKILCMRDTFCDSVPWMKYARQALAAGTLPLWNSYTSLGRPFLANPSSGVFYPPNVLFYLLPTSWALKTWLALHLWIAAASTYALARHWKLKTVPALLAAISFTFSTLVVAQMEFQGQIATSAWIPLDLLLLSSLIERLRQVPAGSSFSARFLVSFPSAATLSLVLAAQFLAGYQQILLFSLILLSAYAVARPLAYREARTLLASIVGLVAAGAAAAGLVAAQLLMTWEFIPLTIRSQGIDPGLAMASLHPSELMMLVLPFVFGRPGYPDHWWARSVFEFWLGTAYIGSIPLILASLSPLALGHKPVKPESDPRRFLCVFWGLVALWAILMAFGKNAPVYMFFYKYFPGFGFFRWPAKLLLLATLSLAMLAGLGCQHILHRPANAKRSLAKVTILLIWLVVSALAAVGWAVGRSRPEVIAWLTGAPDSLDRQRLIRAAHDCGPAAAWLLAGFALVVLLVLIGDRRPLLKALAVGLCFLNLFSVSRQVHGIVDDHGFYDYAPETVTSRAHPYADYRVHSNYSLWGQGFYGSSDRSLFMWAVEAGVGETGLPFHLFKTVAPDPLLLQSVFEVIQQHAHEPKDQVAKLPDLLSIRYVVTGEPYPEILWSGTPRKVRWEERTGYLPRAIVVSRIHNASDCKTAINGVFSPSFDIASEAFVQLEPAEFQRQSDALGPADAAAQSPAGHLESIENGWNRIDLVVDVSRRGLLVLNESWYPGWKAIVNRRPQAVIRADGAFQGVWVEPGRQNVRFIYDPQPLKLGGAVSAATLLAIVLLAAAWLVKKRGNPHRSQAKQSP